MPALTLGPGLSPAAAAAATAAGGMGLTASNTLVATTLQQHIPLSVLSRVSAYDCTASCAYIPSARPSPDPAGLVGLPSCPSQPESFRSSPTWHRLPPPTSATSDGTTKTIMRLQAASRAPRDRNCRQILDLLTEAGAQG